MKWKINKEHNIYIIRSRTVNDSLIKLGYSESINKRLGTYLSCNPFTELLFTCKLNNGKELEKQIHTLFPAVSGKEWYKENLLNIFISYLLKTDYEIYSEELDVSKIKYSNQLELEEDKLKEQRIKDLYLEVERLERAINRINNFNDAYFFLHSCECLIKRTLYISKEYNMKASFIKIPKLLNRVKVLLEESSWYEDQSGTDDLFNDIYKLNKIAHERQDTT